jgi:thioredoxin-like negative regulator of GroEL
MFATLVACTALAGQTAPADIAWARSLNSALSHAKKTKRLVLVDFYAYWSEPCKQMHRETYGDPRVVRKSRDFEMVQIDGEREGRPVARKYRVRGFPETLYLDASGRVVGRIAGFRPPEQMLDDMGRALGTSKDFPIFAARARRSSRDVEALAGLARIYAFRGDGDAASAMLTRAEAADPENSRGFLAGAFNAVGDFWQMSLHFNEAIPLFRKAAKLGKAPSQIAYARASLAACLYSQGRDDEAIRELQAVVAMKDAPEKDKEDARKAIEEIRASRSGPPR